MITAAVVPAALLAVAGLLAVSKLVSSPAPSTKAVALDVLTTIITGALVLTALVQGSSFLLDIALVYAILSFAAVLLVARYLERSV
jgi:multicomponent Na+:H+ antiporter subunit F